MPNDHKATAETAQPEVRTLTTTEYGLRDFLGEITPMPEWRSLDDVDAAIERHRIDPEAVLTRTTVTTTTGWEAAL